MLNFIDKENLRSRPSLTSSRVLSIRTYSDQRTHVTAIKLKPTEHMTLRLSMTFISNFCH